MTRIEQFDAVIAGAGIGGLATALALMKLARLHRVLIVERDEEFTDRRQGYGLTLTNSPTGPLARLGLLDAVLEQNCPSQAHFLFRPEGDLLGYYGRALRFEATNETTTTTSETTSQIIGEKPIPAGGNRGNIRIPRQELRQIMLNSLQQMNENTQNDSNQPKCTVLWGHRIRDYDETDSYVEITLTKSDSTIIKIQTAILIGADGLRSCVRNIRDEKRAMKMIQITANKLSKQARISYLKSNSNEKISIDEINHLANKEAEKVSKEILSKPLNLSSPLHFLGVSVIIGISTVSHPLLNGKGFYVIDGTHRLFTMPYATPGVNSYSSTAIYDQRRKGSTIEIKMKDSHDDETEIPQIMWQLSFSGLSEEESKQLRDMSSAELLIEAQKRTEKWFPASRELISNTLPGEIWATPLYDRDPMTLFSKNEGSRVTVLGDACHPMSMFKGQGANQALEDAPLLAQWLSLRTQPHEYNKTNPLSEGDKETRKRPHESDDIIRTLLQTPKDILYSRLRNFEREMVARSSPKVLASRGAAALLHSPPALEEFFGVSGLTNEADVRRLLDTCKERKIGAYSTPELLESEIIATARDLGLFAKHDSSVVDP